MDRVSGAGLPVEGRAVEPTSEDGARRCWPDFGAFVISLDFELHWGVRDWAAPGGAYRDALIGARRAVPRLLDVFAQYGIAATWATVGMLFAGSRQALVGYWPADRPRYLNPRLSPYDEPVGTDEAHDPLHFARSLVMTIADAPGQELASHTFSHYYCGEPGQDARTFRADLDAARRIAEDSDISLTSLVLPRNQWDETYAQVVREAGFSCYRGNQRGLVHRSRAVPEQKAHRALRLADAYVNLTGRAGIRWDEVVTSNGLCNVAAGRFLRPYVPSLKALEPLRLRRIVTAMRAAATSRQIFHLWWHPHNFGCHLEENVAFLEEVLTVFGRLRDHEGFQSLSMGSVAQMAGAVVR